MMGANKQETCRILIVHKKVNYHFVTFKLNASDGSFYFSIVRKGTNSSFVRFASDAIPSVIKPVSLERKRLKTRDVSYHSSGFIHYKNTSNPPIYAEPLTDITRPFVICWFSVPRIEKLDVYNETVTDRDAIFALDDALYERVQFAFVIAPWDYLPNELSVSARYQSLFSFTVQVSKPHLEPPEALKDHFIFFTPTTGLFDKQVLDNDSALVAFHQKWQNTRDLIVYSPRAVSNLIYGLMCKNA